MHSDHDDPSRSYHREDDTAANLSGMRMRSQTGYFYLPGVGNSWSGLLGCLVIALLFALIVFGFPFLQQLFR